MMPPNFWSLMGKIILAFVLGGILGLERELRGKAAGVKTNALVSLASCTFVILGQLIDPSDVNRIIAGIIQGVGFIGAGLIFKEGNSPKGLTGAAEIWVSSCLGTACGIGYELLAVNIVVLTFLLLEMIRRMEQRPR